MSLKFNQRPPSSKKFVRAKTKKINSKNIFALLSLLLIVGGLTAGYFLTQKQQDIRQQASTAKYDNLPDYSEPENIDANFLIDDTVVATIGKESIYQADINAILAIFPPFSDEEKPSIIKEIINDFIEDSILLQEYQQTDIEIFSSPFKNYAKRAEVVGQLIDQKKTELWNQGPCKKGSIITLWTANDEAVAENELIRRRKVVKKKIEALKNQLQTGKLTIKQIGQKIVEDNSLIEFDNNYKGNALVDFNIRCFNNQNCEGSSFFLTKKIWQLQLDEITDIVLYQSPKTAEEYYAFAQVTEVNNLDQPVTTYQQWLAKTKLDYEIDLK